MAIVSVISPDGGTTNFPVGSNLYGTCSTAASTATKQVTLINSWSTGSGDPPVGLTVHVKFTYANTSSSPKLKVGDYTAKDIAVYGTASPLSDDWKANAIVSFTYDGARWLMNDYTQNTDASVWVEKRNGNSYYPLFFSYSDVAGWATVSSASDTAGIAYDLNIKANPSTGDIAAVTFNGYTLGAACAKGIGSVTDGDTDLVTGDAVYDAIAAAIGQATGSMVYQGTVSSAMGLLNSVQKAGYVYMASSAFTITDRDSVVHSVEVGDMIIFKANVTPSSQQQLWTAIDLIQTNMDALTTSDVDAAIAEAEAA